jgi:uncharacterized membrane protein
MPSFEHSITVQRSLFDVFKYLSDFERATQWQAATSSARVTAGNPVRVGTMVSQNRRLLGPVFINADVIDYQVNKQIQLQGVFQQFPFTRTYRVESIGGMQTRVHDHMVMQTGCLYAWYTPVLSLMLKRQIAEEWQQFKKILEARQERV